jgi:hypothetical protein
METTTHDLPSIDALADHAAAYATGHEGLTAPAGDGITVRFTSWITDAGDRRTNVTADASAERTQRELVFIALTPGERDREVIAAALRSAASQARLLLAQPAVRSSTTALRACAVILAATSSVTGHGYELAPLVRAAHAAGVSRDDLVSLMRSGYETSWRSRGWNPDAPEKVATSAVDRALAVEFEDERAADDDRYEAGRLVLQRGADRLGEPTSPDASETALDRVLRSSRQAADLARAQEAAVQTRDDALRAAAAAGVRSVDLVKATGLTKGRISQILKLSTGPVLFDPMSQFSDGSDI